MAIFTTKRHTGRPGRSRNRNGNRNRNRRPGRPDHIAKALKTAARMTPKQKETLLAHINFALNVTEKASGGRGCPGTSLPTSAGTPTNYLTGETAPHRHARLTGAGYHQRQISAMDGPPFIANVIEYMPELQSGAGGGEFKLGPECPWKEHDGAAECALNSCFDICAACGCRVTHDPARPCRSCESGELLRRQETRLKGKLEAKAREELERQRGAKRGKWGKGPGCGDQTLGVVGSLGLPVGKDWAGGPEAGDDDDGDDAGKASDGSWYPDFDLYEQLFGLTDEEKKQKERVERRKKRQETKKEEDKARKKVEDVERAKLESRRKDREVKAREKREDSLPLPWQLQRDYKVAYFLRNYFFKAPKVGL